MMINYSYAGLEPWKWHLTAVLLHVIASMLAYSLLLATLRWSNKKDCEQVNRLLAGVGASCFAIHPAQSESVAWIAPYVQSLCAIFLFGPLLAYLRARRDEQISWSWLHAGAGLYVLA